jgi:3-methyl-2-oxobutanoate hydroxymethyltransferase
MALSRKEFSGKRAGRMKKNVLDFQKMKQAGEKVAWLTSYDFPTARFAEKAGMDMILVGDSMGMCVYGYTGGTMPVTMDQCLVHSEAVRRGAPNTFVIGDMPFLSYQTTPADAVRNAGRFLKKAELMPLNLRHYF